MSSIEEGEVSEEWSGNLLTMGEDAWDDSQLLDAFDADVRGFRSAKQAAAGDVMSDSTKHASPRRMDERGKKRANESEHIEGRRSHKKKARAVPIPHVHCPPPSMNTSGPSIPPGLPSDDEELANLLLAWYYSGYYTGRFMAMQERKSG